MIENLKSVLQQWWTAFATKTRSASSWRISSWLYFDSRSSVQYSLLRLLSVAQSERLEVAPLVVLLSDEHRGATQRRLRQLAKRLAAGTPLIEALEQTPDALSDNDTLALRFASHTGTVPATLSSLVGRASSAANDVGRNLRQAFIYFFGMVCALWLALIVLLIVVAPTFFELGIESKPLRSLADCFYVVGRYIPLGIVSLVVVSAVGWWFEPGRFFRRMLASRLVRPIAQLRSVDLLRMLALAIDAGRPLPGSISVLARYHFDSNVRTKLLFARNEVEQGAENWESLSAAKLITQAESVALAQSSSNRGRCWLMHRLADWKECRVQQRASILSTLIQPALVVLFGLVVLWIGVAFLGSLSKLITELA